MKRFQNITMRKAKETVEEKRKEISFLSLNELIKLYELDIITLDEAVKKKWSRIKIYFLSALKRIKK